MPTSQLASESAELPGIADKLAFLSRAEAYGPAPARVAVVETHMSYVFLAGARVYKLKKPVRFPFLDFTTLESRERNCREEVRLNSRLSPSVYLGVAPLTFDAAAGFSIAGRGRIVDWLVEMRRLPDEEMLDKLILSGRLRDAHIGAIAETLSRFYCEAPPSVIAAAEYSKRFFDEQAINRDILSRTVRKLDRANVAAILDGLDRALIENRAALDARVTSGCIVDGHGDLRPEHICLTTPVAIFDCLEFNRDLRQVDPFDEMMFLGMECAQLGAEDFGRKLIAEMAQRLRRAPSAQLLSLYGAWRAVLRARLSIAHLLDASPRQPEKWEPLAGRYLELAQRFLGGQ